MSVFHSYGAETSLQSLGNGKLHTATNRTALSELKIAMSGGPTGFPEARAALWNWCLKQDQDTLLELLAFCAGCTVDAVQTKQDRPRCDSRFAWQMLWRPRSTST